MTRSISTTSSRRTGARSAAFRRASFNSIVNKTPLSKRSNITVGGRAPSVYLRRIEAEQGLSSEVLDEILRTHLIEPQHLRSDDFDAFFEARISALCSLVAEAMEKPVIEETGGNENETETPFADIEADAYDVETALVS